MQSQLNRKSTLQLQHAGPPCLCGHSGYEWPLSVKIITFVLTPFFSGSNKNIIIIYIFQGYYFIIVIKFRKSHTTKRISQIYDDWVISLATCHMPHLATSCAVHATYHMPHLAASCAVHAAYQRGCDLFRLPLYCFYSIKDVFLLFIFSSIVLCALFRATIEMELELMVQGKHFFLCSTD